MPNATRTRLSGDMLNLKATARGAMDAHIFAGAVVRSIQSLRQDALKLVQSIVWSFQGPLLGTPLRCKCPPAAAATIIFETHPEERSCNLDPKLPVSRDTG